MSKITEAIKTRYGHLATQVDQHSGAKCCSANNKDRLDPITRNLYSTDEESTLPEKAVQASLGCGNPTAMVDILPGQTVLDLGSGTPPA